MSIRDTIKNLFKPHSDLPLDNLTMSTSMGLINKSYPLYVNLKVENINKARSQALSPILPDRLQLQQMYKRCFDDAHLQAQINNRMGKVLASKYELDLDQTLVYEIMKYVLEALYYGYTLLDFQLKDGKIKIYSIERENIIPERSLLFLNRMTQEFIYYKKDDKMIADNIIEIDTHSLGLLQYALFYVLQKLTATQDWCSFSERYGTPPIIIQMNDKDPAKIQNRKEFIENFGAGLGVLADKADTITVLNAFNGSYMTYSHLIKYCNDEVSKLISGGTMLSDAGSSRAQSQVHENTFNSLVESDKLFLTGIINDKILPLLSKLLNKSITNFKFIETLETGKEDKPTKESNRQNSSTNDTNTVRDRVDNKHNSPNEIHNQALLVDATEEEEEFIRYIYYAFTGLTLLKPIQYTADKLIAAFSDTFPLTDTTTTFLQEIEKNTKIFSLFKAHNMRGEMQALLTEVKKSKGGFKEFREDALKISRNYNVNHLKAEYNTAIATAQMAEKWINIYAKNNNYLKYSSVGDARVRPEHQILDNIVQRADSDFWKTNYPPLGWNCRCTVIELGEEETPTPIPQNLPHDPGFANNTAQTGKIFSEEHPYYTNISNKGKASLIKEYKQTLNI